MQASRDSYLQEMQYERSFQQQKQEYRKNLTQNRITRNLEELLHIILLEEPIHHQLQYTNNPKGRETVHIAKHESTCEIISSKGFHQK